MTLLSLYESKMKFKSFNLLKCIYYINKNTNVIEKINTSSILSVLTSFKSWNFCIQVAKKTSLLLLIKY